MAFFNNIENLIRKVIKNIQDAGVVCYYSANASHGLNMDVQFFNRKNELVRTDSISFSDEQKKQHGLELLKENFLPQSAYKQKEFLVPPYIEKAHYNLGTIENEKLRKLKEIDGYTMHTGALNPSTDNNGSVSYGVTLYKVNEQGKDEHIFKRFHFKDAAKAYQFTEEVKNNFKLYNPTLTKLEKQGYTEFYKLKFDEPSRDNNYILFASFSGKDKQGNALNCRKRFFAISEERGYQLISSMCSTFKFDKDRQFKKNLAPKISEQESQPQETTISLLSSPVSLSPAEKLKKTLGCLGL